MSDLFIWNDDLVAVSLDDDPANIIWIRRKMNLGTTNKIQDALISLRGLDDKGSYEGVDLNIGMQQTLLLEFNIVKWEGPRFKDRNDRWISCTPQYIRMLDPDDPLVEKVLEEIGQRNKKKKDAPDPKLLSGGGGTSSPGTAKKQSGSTTITSS